MDEIYNKCILDKLLYGGYALQIIWDRVGESIAEIYHMDFSKIRSNVDNTEFYFSNDWEDPRAKTKDNAEQVVEAFNKTKDAMKENEKVIERRIELAKAEQKGIREIYTT